MVILKQGLLKSRTDFNQLESEAYPLLYPESASRNTENKAINTLQGRCVGGSPTVNWSISFRTRLLTLKFWQDRFSLSNYSALSTDTLFRAGRAALEHYAVAGCAQ